MIAFSNEKKFSIQISFSRLIEQYIKRIEERNKDKKAYKRNQRKKRKHILYQSILSFKIFD